MFSRVAENIDLRNRFALLALSGIIVFLTGISFGDVSTYVKALGYSEFQSVQKDMTSVRLGADAESFATAINFNTLLTQQNSEFAQFLSDVGSPVMRMATMGRYSDYGEEESKACAAVSGWSCNGGTGWWFDMDDFHQFCRQNNIKLIGMLDTMAVWDPVTQQAIEVRNTPENFSYGVQAAIDKITAIEESGYSDLYVAWEFGNENYNYWWSNRFADYLNLVIPAVKAIDPDIKLAVEVNSSKTQFCADYLNRLGSNIAQVDYINLHLYGASAIEEPPGKATSWGISDALSVLDYVNNTDHLRTIITEWRHDYNADDNHREFNTAVLWKAKYTMTMLAEPTLDYTCVHDVLTWSGVGYWSDGDTWKRQINSYGVEIASQTGEPELDVGPYGQVMKRFNDALSECPLLLDHFSELGPQGDEMYYENGTSDLEWMLFTNEDHSKLIGIAVNTYEDMQLLQLDEGAFADINITYGEAISCLPGYEETPGIPGGDDYLTLATCVFSENMILLPGNSFIYFEADTFVIEPLLGDANRDGVISSGDYACIQANFGNTGAADGSLLGDANFDGTVSAGDYACVQANFGLANPVGQTPEPATIILFASGCVFMLRRRAGNR